MRSALHIASEGRWLAQSRQAPPVELWIWLGALVVATLVLGVILLAMRRRLLDSDDAEPGAGSMLDDLRAMRDRGEISQAEYDHTRKTIAARAAGREPPPRPDESRSPEAPDGSVAARPGYDLTGAPLPRPESPKRPGDPERPPEQGADPDAKG